MTVTHCNSAPLQHRRVHRDKVRLPHGLHWGYNAFEELSAASQFTELLGTTRSSHPQPAVTILQLPATCGNMSAQGIRAASSSPAGAGGAPQNVLVAVPGTAQWRARARATSRLIASQGLGD